MALFIPNTIIRLCSGVPLDSSYNNTIRFASASAQSAYFASKAKYSFTDFSYQRVNDTIRVPANAEVLFDVNYIMFQNNNFGTKWFYAFVKNVAYKNQNDTEISFELDVMQTWWFDWTWKESYVEREHAPLSEAIGDYLEDENLAVSDYINNSSVDWRFGNCYVIVATPYKFDTVGWNTIQGSVISNIYSGIGYLAFDPDIATELADLNTYLKTVTDTKTGSIRDVYMIPRDFISRNSPSATSDPYLVTSSRFGNESFYCWLPQYSGFTGLDHYIPKNKKLLTYPYNYLEVYSDTGMKGEYRYEFFDKESNGLAYFRIWGNITPIPEFVAVPYNYKNSSNDYENMLSFGNMPHCIYQEDSYQQWIAQNSGQIAGKYLGNTAMASLGLLTAMAASGAGLAIAGTSIMLSSVLNSVQTGLEIGDKKASAGIVGSGASSRYGANVTGKFYGVHLYKKSIIAEKAKVIDDFFEMFGYKTNRLKIPNFNNRKYWNFIKTTACNITPASGNGFPVNDLEKIKLIFNNGITLWHTTDVGNYALNNHAAL